ncbi:hypothetical protein D3C77_728910 [compost metagenome]
MHDHAYVDEQRALEHCGQGPRARFTYRQMSGDALELRRHSRPVAADGRRIVRKFRKAQVATHLQRKAPAVKAVESSAAIDVRHR